jgi:hypothetical protein
MPSQYGWVLLFKEQMNIEEGDYVMFFEEGNRVYIDIGKLVLK